MLFRLRTPHVIDGAVRSPGTIVGPYGSGAPVIYAVEPTPDMEGADEEGVSKVREVFKRLYDQDPPWEHPEDRHGDRRARRPSGELRAYAADDHPDNQEVDEEAQKKAAAAMAEANAKPAHRMGTIPASPGHATAVRPATTDTLTPPAAAASPLHQAQSRSPDPAREKK